MGGEHPERALVHGCAAAGEGIRRGVETWQRVLRDGGPRARARDIATVCSYLNHVRSALLDWSTRYDHLREVTRGDVLAVLDDLHGSQRINTLVALRSLFAFCKKTATIFRNPTSRIKVGQREYGVIQPLGPAEVEQAVTVASYLPHELLSTFVAHLQLRRVSPPARPATVLNSSRIQPLETLPLAVLPTRTTVSGHAFSRSAGKRQTGLTSPLCRRPPGQ
jgi:hypothetical protein